MFSVHFAASSPKLRAQVQRHKPSSGTKCEPETWVEFFLASGGQRLRNLHIRLLALTLLEAAQYTFWYGITGAACSYRQ
jgi:hypothetical protein